jgi:MFS transporter, MHS family, proline/betaine transporter
MVTSCREVLAGGESCGGGRARQGIALAFVAAIAPVLGRVCDKIGRRITMVASSVLLGGLAVPAYLLASTGGFGNALAGQLLLALGAVTANVVTAVLLSEVFPTAVRYTASAITYNVSYAIFGGTAPFVATFLIASTGNKLAPAIYLTAIAAAALLAAFLLPETNGCSMRASAAAVPGAGAAGNPATGTEKASQKF